jgi:hypothetical protein
MISYTDVEIEAERKETLSKILRDRNTLPADLTSQYLNPYGYREVLHLSFVLHETINHYLLEHPCITLNPNLWKLAHNASTALFNLYQALGELEHNSERSK